MRMNTPWSDGSAAARSNVAPASLAALCLTALCLVSSGCHTDRPAAAATPPVTAPAPAAEPAPAQTKVQTFQVRGVVREVQEGGKVAVIRHEEISGYMAAMTMSFDVKEPVEMAEVHPGDKVSFRLTVTDTDGWIDQIRVLERGAANDAKPVVPEVRVVREVEELEEGDVMPDYPFVTESRRPIRLSDFRGQALGLTFIYTRCPYPTFCPRQTRQFAEAMERLSKALPGPAKRWHLLSISFDPAYDTPAVLYRYAQQHGYDPAWWNFCTGEMIEIDAITEQLGMIFARDGEGFSHNVRTVVITPDGHVQKMFIGNQWTTEEFVAEMVKAAGGAR
jgi:protein SCO1